MGGGLLTDSFEWGATLPVILASPPDAATVGDSWRDLWQKRLDKLSFPLDNWIRHCTRGAYWRHGSVIFNADRLSCPVLAIGGWADRYSNSVMALVQARPDICRGIVGPWGHHYPDQGEPGPAAGFQELALAWWERWLKDDTGDVPDWPRLRLWRREFDPPQDRLNQRSGEWIEIDDAGDSRIKTLYLGSRGLTHRPGVEDALLELPNDPLHGECAGDTGYFGRPGGLPLDQSADDARSLCFDSAPLEKAFDLVGCAELACEITRDREEAQIVCRLCEVAPDGRSHLVTRQILALALDESMDTRPLFNPGKPVRYRIRLPSTAYRFAKGNRIRLALGTSYWPLVWPVSNPAKVRISTGEACLSLPRPDRVGARPNPSLMPGCCRLDAAGESEAEGPLQRKREMLPDGRIRLSWKLPLTTIRYGDIDTDIALQTSTLTQVDVAESVSWSYTIDHTIEIRRPDGCALVQSSLAAESDRKACWSRGNSPCDGTRSPWRTNGGASVTRRSSWYLAGNLAGIQNHDGQEDRVEQECPAKGKWCEVFLHGCVPASLRGLIPQESDRVCPTSGANHLTEKD